MTYKEFYDRTRPPCTLGEFTLACERFFQAQFKELRCVGADFRVRSWLPADDSSPFFVLAKQVAADLYEKCRYCPMEIQLFGTLNGPDTIMQGVFIGVLAEYAPTGTSLRLLYLIEDGLVRVTYTFPESYSEIHENGTSSGGGCQDRHYDFDLADPACLDGVFGCVAGRLRDMLESEHPHRPSS